MVPSAAEGWEKGVEGLSGTMKMFSILIRVVAAGMHKLAKTPQTAHF